MAAIQKKILRWTTYFTAAVAATIFAALILFYAGAQNYLNKNLSEFVEKKSKGKYELSFEDLQIDFANWGLEINQVKFHPKDSINRAQNSNNPNRQIYSFSSPSVSFKGIGFISLIFEKKLEISEILIDQPDLKIHGTEARENDEKDNINSLILELKPLVTKTFKSIKIDKIELTNASFDFYKLMGDTRKLANAENISIGILNFYTDSLLLPDPDRLFSADDIYLKMNNYQNKLKDSVHVVRAETITYSLKKNHIEAQNIELKPLSQTLSAHDKYSISVPKLRIASSQIKEFYRNSQPVPHCGKQSE